MSIIDANLQFAEDVAITSATTYTSDTIALRNTGQITDEFYGEPMEVVIQITDTFENGTNCDFRVVTGNTDALGSPQTQHSTGAKVTAVLTEGTKYRLPFDIITGDADATHIGIQAVSAGVHTAGTYSAWVQRAGEDQVTINDH